MNLPQERRLSRIQFDEHNRHRNFLTAGTRLVSDSFFATPKPMRAAGVQYGSTWLNDTRRPHLSYLKVTICMTQWPFEVSAAVALYLPMALT